MDRFIGWLNVVTLALVVVGALNWGLVGAFRFNLVSFLAQKTFQGLEPTVYVLVGVSAILHLVSRDYYLPFLGAAAYPCGSLQERVPDNANRSVRIRTHPHSSVVYWAAESGSGVADNPRVAYGENSNSGATTSDAQGRAVLRVRAPASYRVGLRRPDPHVHYRTCRTPSMLGPVHTAKMPVVRFQV